MKLKSIHLKNFKSFINEKFDFDTKTNANYIYGANGIGKTTFIQSFSFLMEMFDKELSVWNLSSIPTNVRQTLPNGGIIDIYNMYKTAGSQEEIFVSLEIEDIDKKELIKYSIGIIQGDIVTRESLEVYDLNGKKLRIIFNKDLNKLLETSEELDHFELNNINKTTTSSLVSFAYLSLALNKNMSSSDNTIIRLFHSLMVRLEALPNEINNLIRFDEVVIPKDINGNPADGNTSAKVKMNSLKKYLEEFEVFVMSIDSSIKGVKATILREDNFSYVVSYSFVKVMSNGKTSDILIHFESTGTRRYLDIYSKLVSLKQEEYSNIVFIDELGKNLHEELIIKLANYINKNAYKFNKHVFITTHNAILLNDKFVVRPEVKNSNKEKHFLNRRSNGSLVMDNLKSENVRNNNHLKFLMGEYGAGPDISEINTIYDE